MWLEPMGVPAASNSRVTWLHAELVEQFAVGEASTEAASPPALSRMMLDSSSVLPLV